MSQDAWKYTTAVLPDLGIDGENIPVPDYEDIRKNKTAYLLFIHKVKEQGEAYQKELQANEEAMQRIVELEKKAEYRKSAVIIMTAAELVTAVGVSGLFTNYPVPFGIVLSTGLLMTAVSLYLNFKNVKTNNKT